MFQARYQNARHYARRAMGKAASMDVAHTETLTEAHGGLYAIVALVVIAQAWQVRTGTGGGRAGTWLRGADVRAADVPGRSARARTA